MVFKRTLHFCWWTLAVGVVTLAVALSTARLLLPGMSDYRAQVEKLAAGIFQRPVSIGSLNAAWHAFSPVLKLHNVVVEDPRLSGGKLVVQEVEVAFDLLASLWQGQWRTDGVKIIGVDLDLTTDLRHPAETASLRSVLDWLVPQESIAVEQIHLVWHDAGLFSAPLRLTGLSAQLVNEGSRHQLLVQADLPRLLGKSVQIAADLQGSGSDIAKWRGTLYLHTRGLRLPNLRPALADTGVLATGAVDLELWVGLVRKRAVWGSGHISVDNPGLRTASADAQGIAADRLAARFHWQAQQRRWRIGINNFQLRRDSHVVWPASSFDLLYAPGDEVRVQGRASLLVLEEVNSVLPLLPSVDDDALAMLDRLQPTGLMRNAEFEMRHRAGEAPRIAVRAAIENLTFAANSGLPGVSGISGQVEGNLQAGLLRLDTREAMLIAPKVFAKPLPLTRLSGAVHWQRFKDIFRVETRKLKVESGPLSLISRWHMDWSYDQPVPWLDMQLAAQPLTLNAVVNYLPTEVMSDKAVHWLQQAFKAGSADNLRLLVQGRLDQIPFSRHQGRFEARFDFDQVHLDYSPQWGALDELDGDAVFSGRSARITGRTARILDSSVQRTVATIDNLAEPVLDIDGAVDGTLAGMLGYIHSTPLEEHFGALINAVDASGDARLQLSLKIPLKHGLGETQIDGDVALEGNNLVPKHSEVGLKDIKGNLHFNRHGIRVDAARAKVFGQPVDVSVYQLNAGGTAQTVVDIDGALKLVGLLHKRKSPWAPFLDGETQWLARLKISRDARPRAQRIVLELSSKLRGVAIKLPSPLGKPADEERAFRVAWVPGKETELPLDVSYGDTVRARALLAPSRQLRKAALQFGGDEAQLPARDEIQLSGRLAFVDLGRWLSLLEPSKLPGGSAIPVGMALHVDKLQFGDGQVAQISVTSQAVDPWHFTIEGQGAKGWVRWIPGDRSSPARLLAKLSSLSVTGVSGSAPVASTADLQPTKLPELNIGIGELRWDGRDFGDVGLVSKRTAEGAHFETLHLNSPAITLDGEGDWLVHEGSQFSRVKARISQGDLARLSAMYGNGDSVKGGKLEGEFQLSWPGTPADLTLSSMEGDVTLEARDGRLENVEEGAGKLLSLFSLNSLQRRLNLDFRDIVKEGFSFDRMQGHFVVMDGNAFTNDFSIKGTSVNIDISGRTGLVDHDYDQLVTVTPQVTSTLPIAGAIAGGPAVGAAVYLADKLVGDRFNRLTRVQYRVTGSWDKPIYTKLKKDAPKGKKSTEDIDGEDS